MSRKAIGPQATHEVLRAFVALAECLNLTDASKSLGLTRQTVRRYIDVLEGMKGGPLFELRKNGYVLTPLGDASLPEAQYILNRTDRFCSPSDAPEGVSAYLDAQTFHDTEGRTFHTQQHPISSLSHKACPLIQRAVASWALAAMRLEAEDMTSARPFLIVYRNDVRGWRCVEIGEDSAYAKWFGWTWSKSAVGKLSFEDEAGDTFDRAASDTYLEVFNNGGVRLDHVFAHLPRESESGPVPVTFQRLLLTCLLPDDTPVIAVLVAITNDVDINALGPDRPKVVPSSLEMNVE